MPELSALTVNVLVQTESTKVNVPTQHAAQNIIGILRFRSAASVAIDNTMCRVLRSTVTCINVGMHCAAHFVFVFEHTYAQMYTLTCNHLSARPIVMISITVGSLIGILWPVVSGSADHPPLSAVIHQHKYWSGGMGDSYSLYTKPLAACCGLQDTGPVGKNFLLVDAAT